MNESLKTALKLIVLVLVGSAIGFSPTVISVTQNAQKVTTAFAAEEYRTGADYLLDLVEEYPWWTSLWERAGQAAFQDQAYSLARDAYLGAYQRGLLTEAGQINLGLTYFYLGDAQSAEEVWQELADSPAARRELAGLYEEAGDISRAVEQWSHYLILLETNPEPGVLYHFGLLIAADSPPKALVYLDQASKEYPQAGKVASGIREALREEPAYQLVSAGQALAAVDEWRLAAHAFEKAATLRPDYPEAWFYWGEALQHLPDPPQDPLETLQRGLSLDQESALGNFFLGLYWQRIGSHAVALDFFAVVETLWPDRVDVLVEQGKSLAALGELDAAYLKYQTAVELNPREPDYYRTLAEFCLVYSYQIRETALPAGRLAVQLGPQDPANLDVLGQVLLALEDEMNAINLYQRALEIDPTYALASYHLGIVYSAQEETELAVYYLNQAVANSSNLALIDQAQRLLSAY